MNVRPTEDYFEIACTQTDRVHHAACQPPQTDRQSSGQSCYKEARVIAGKVVVMAQQIASQR
jgi:hypothetical protein